MCTGCAAKKNPKKSKRRKKNPQNFGGFFCGFFWYCLKIKNTQKIKETAKKTPKNSLPSQIATFRVANPVYGANPLAYWVDQHVDEAKLLVLFFAHLIFLRNFYVG